MSTFGSPGTLTTVKPNPPQRGSFPLDHEGECKHVMTEYLACMKAVRGANGTEECRNLSKAYLTCRMDRNLMARDEMKNLGFATPEERNQQPQQTPQQPADKRS